jgi:UDP-N-acetylglucosamine:LPS N-acetylglucosamine transferase
LEKPEFLWLGGSGSHEEKTAKSENIEFQSIPTLKLATTRSWRILLYPFYLMMGFWQARQILKSLIE